MMNTELCGIAEGRGRGMESGSCIQRASNMSIISYLEKWGNWNKCLMLDMPKIDGGFSLESLFFCMFEIIQIKIQLKILKRKCFNRD